MLKLHFRNSSESLKFSDRFFRMNFPKRYICEFIISLNGMGCTGSAQTKKSRVKPIVETPANPEKKLGQQIEKNENTQHEEEPKAQILPSKPIPMVGTLTESNVEAPPMTQAPKSKAAPLCQAKSKIAANHLFMPPSPETPAVFKFDYTLRFA